MKPLHVGLLIAGAAIAGALAVKMTQAPALPKSAATQHIASRRTSSQAKPVVQAPEPAPPAVTSHPESSASLPVGSAAPPPVYSKPSPAPPVRKKAAEPGREVSPKPEPVQTPAKAEDTTLAKNVPPPYSAPVAGASGVNKSQPESNGPQLPQSGQNGDPALDHDQPSTEPAPLVPAPRQVTLRAGTQIRARLIESLSSDKVRAGDSFQATLAEPLIVGDLVIAERGARVTGKVLDAAEGGKFQGVSRLELELVNVYSSDGQKVAISTSPWRKQTESVRNSDVAKIGGGAALGAIIGAIAGGGKGAAIGAGVGGAAGTGAVMIPPTKPIVIPTETVIQFRLSAPVTITERI